MYEFEHHPKSCVTRSQPLGLVGAKTHRGEDALDRVGASYMAPVRGRETVEAQKRLTVFLQTFNGLRILITVALAEVRERLLCLRFALSAVDVMNQRLRARLDAFGQAGNGKYF